MAYLPILVRVHNISIKGRRREVAGWLKVLGIHSVGVWKRLGLRDIGLSKKCLENRYHRNKISKKNVQGKWVTK